MAKPITVRAIGPAGVLVVKGQTALALLALVKASKRGVTALEVNSWAYRFAAYCYDLRRKHGLAIETLRETHQGSWHGRHVLHTPVEIVEVQAMPVLSVPTRGRLTKTATFGRVWRATHDRTVVV